MIYNGEQHDNGLKKGMCPSMKPVIIFFCVFQWKFLEPGSINWREEEEFILGRSFWDMHNEEELLMYDGIKESVTSQPKSVGSQRDVVFCDKITVPLFNCSLGTMPDRDTVDGGDKGWSVVTFCIMNRRIHSFLSSSVQITYLFSAVRC